MEQLSNWNLLVVDDDPDVCKNLKEQIESLDFDDEKGFIVQTTTSFEEAISILELQKVDLVILDVRVGSLSDEVADPDDEVGRKTLAQIKSKVFVPIIFHTGLPSAVSDLESSFIKVVTKDADSDERLAEEIRNALDTRLPEINRAIVRHFEQVQRKYMWEFVHDNWSEFDAIGSRSDLAHLLARRLSISLSIDEIDNLETELGGLVKESALKKDKSHPMRFYIIPPISEFPKVCDIYQNEDDSSYWLVFNPSCDLIPRSGKCNADFITVAACDLLSSQKEYIDYQLSPNSSNKRKNLKSLLDNGKPDKRQYGRYFFLPGAWKIPHMLVDFQNLRTVPVSTFFVDDSPWKRIASIDSPFRESIISRFNTFVGRIGTPDIDTDAILEIIKKLSSPD